jgi:threonine/homoserine/homoserine lactone efflux protein
MFVALIPCCRDQVGRRGQNVDIRPILVASAKQSDGAATGLQAFLKSYKDILISLYDWSAAMSVILFLLAATALLGSPGPGIAALIVAGRTLGLAGGLRLYAGMQVGLALAAALSAAGLASVLTAVPALHTALTVISVAYLAWLAWSVATAPVGDGAIGGDSSARLTFMGGLVLGAANPKAYLAFVSLFGSFAVVEAGSRADAAVKWALCVLVMVVVDLAWLALGVVLGKIQLGAKGQRAMNLAMGGSILAAAGLSLVG